MPSLGPVTFAVLIISLVAVIGLLLGNMKIRGIGVGPTGVLFAGILFGHFGADINHDIAHFAKEFGLILFVYTMGIELGPGIVQLWRQQGWVLNAMAVAIVLQGFVLVSLFNITFDLSVSATAGLFSGSTTNTPSLGAAEQAIGMLENVPPGGVSSLASAYAVCYPGGVMGIIASMLLIKYLFKVDTAAEDEQLRSQSRKNHAPIERAVIEVDNEHLDGTPFGKIPGVEETNIRISRIRKADSNQVEAATAETQIHSGDLIQVVGHQENLDRFTPLVGKPSQVDLMTSTGNVEFRRIFITEPNVLNKTLRELSLDQVFNVTVTRIIRSAVEMTARGSSRFYYGDIAHVVGDKESLDRVTKFLGNSSKSMLHTPFTPLFAGIAAGVTLGSIPIHFPGIPFPVQLGLAGGPLLAAILFSLIGSFGKFVWYIPTSANLAMRNLGIILFLACAGLGAGQTFFAAVTSFEGVKWLFAGIMTTMIPLLTTGIISRIWAKQNYLIISGVIAGAMTDPPALAFANSLTKSERCSTAYAAVYPLTMILRIIIAQVIVFLFA